ncbi:hypothetical protein CY34DRAFT_548842 [Suillus luteus UH-Slu-Lm8-n1]|uniref:Uncharacterized protein n=1 Tax=Suillus luteus UH-Slu-Lm8-n1 TaxID=930992 RepID=A0A0D0BGQ0_9AGAM|nr:hypothetical protein CY34DRAFT_548842 [Suillus luteus UH-Slu-Lm8-n1]
MVLVRNEWDSHGEAEAILVDLDWPGITRSSPVELYGPIDSTFYPTYDAQPYEDTDVVMGPPAHPMATCSPTPEQIQDPASLESYWGAEPPRSTTPTGGLPQDSSAWGVNPPHSPASEEGPKSWGYSPWETDASKGESTEDSSLWGTDATKDEPTEGSSRGTKPPRSSTPGPLQDA